MPGEDREGQNTTSWFPDKRVLEDLHETAEEMKTSASAIIYSLVKEALPVIKRNKNRRSIRLDGVTIKV